MRQQKEKNSKDFKKQIEQLEIELSNYKCQLATLQFDMDRKIVTYKKYVKKLQTKLESLGYRFKDKNSATNLYRHSVYLKSKTFV